jgi:DNA-binding MarR family transcriptional regulator
MLLLLLAHGGPQKAGDLAVALGVKAPATTSIIDALEKDGYVRREHASEDRRVITVSLTDAGAEVLELAKARRREHMRVVMEGLDAADVEALIRIQRRIIVSLVDPSA